jgi:hypothetical protein
VCLDDVTLKAESPNPVIYNPKHIKDEYARRLLHDIIKNNAQYDLSSKQLDELLQYDEYHLDEFVLKLRKMISYQ